MLKTNRVFHIENAILGIVVMTSSYIIALVLANLGTHAELVSMSYAQQGLTIEHNIQAKSQLNNCTYSISISVWDNKTRKTIPNALVEFKTPLTGFVTNTTDQTGSTVISLSLAKKPVQETCIETLFSQGYSIEAASKGYTGHGIGTIS